MRDFTGVSAHYLKQQTQTALAALRPLQKLEPDSERQGLEAVIEECSARLKELSVVETITAADVGTLKVGM